MTYPCLKLARGLTNELETLGSNWLVIPWARTYLNEILFEIHKFPPKKIHFKMPSTKCRPSCGGLSVLEYVFVCFRLWWAVPAGCDEQYPLGCDEQHLSSGDEQRISGDDQRISGCEQRNSGCGEQLRSSCYSYSILEPFIAVTIDVPLTIYTRADSRFPSSQWETALFCNDVSHRPVSQIRAPPGGLSRTSGKLWQNYSNWYMFWT